MLIDDCLFIVRRYLCSRCWGQLIVLHDEDHQAYIACPDCGKDIGMITSRSVERMEQENKSLALLARKNLSSLFPQEKITANQALKELGF